ncbi:flagellar biosynthesis anti-sigma factor FlgM [Luteimonas abyssi]|uniref:flagellar biosynthesis anti-sigma factor FlgM n=1 Tax=Luteimonas abyssi TaxID=1247514 RepID=UPI000737C2BE|nr:flagellar biosynthesis anti-sigma factor FlgM [Luteimonas abyssi]
MSQKIEGTPPPAVRSTGPIGNQVGRAGEARDKAIEAPAAADSLRLTGEAAGLQALQRDLSARPAFDEARVQAVRESLASGQYRIDPEAIAQRMLDLDGQLGG